MTTRSVCSLDPAVPFSTEQHPRDADLRSNLLWEENLTVTSSLSFSPLSLRSPSQGHWSFPSSYLLSKVKTPGERPQFILLLSSTLNFLLGRAPTSHTVRVPTLRAAGCGLASHPLSLGLAWLKAWQPCLCSPPAQHTALKAYSLALSITPGFTPNVFWGKRFH